MLKSKNSNKQNKRPFPVTINFPGRDAPPVIPQVRPGNSKYSETVNFDRKTFVDGTSLVK